MLDKVRDAAGRKILFLPHALRQMLRPARLITANEVRLVVERGSIIEEYLDDPRGPSCPILGYGLDNRPIHIVCAPKADFLAVITAYLPDAEEWYEDFRKRKKP
jgi:hypothetical protein